MPRTLIAGNWKMNGTIPETRSIIQSLLNGNSRREGVSVLVCPPFPSLAAAAELLSDSHIALGGQDMSAHEKGAFTGEVSASMLLTVGASYVILGHSERRQYHSETDQLVNAKAKLAFSSGLTPILCVGETLEQRESGATEAVVTEQIRGVTADLGREDLSKAVIAYEPVWAIGTGRNATPEQAQEVHALIRRLLGSIDETVAQDVPILYGGSVKASNAAELLARPDINGALVGGASLKAEEFIVIISAA